VLLLQGPRWPGDGLHSSSNNPTLYCENHPSLYQGGGCVSSRIPLLLCLLLALAGCAGKRPPAPATPCGAHARRLATH